MWREGKERAQGFLKARLLELAQWSLYRSGTSIMDHTGGVRLFFGSG
jgi:hypothetical protein